MNRPSPRASGALTKRRLTGLFASVVVLLVLAALISALTGKNFFETAGDLLGRGGGSGSSSSVGSDPGASSSGSSDDRWNPTGQEVAEARQHLKEIKVAEPQPRGDYERKEFGSPWIDTDKNGCSTRNDILARDLEGARVNADCKVLEGTLEDPYTGEMIEFSADKPQAVQVDHLVPLSLAWRMGASEWDRDKRVQFANDPDNLFASDGPANMQKGDAGPGEWQPYEGFQCSYAVSYVDVTLNYDLPIAKEDRTGLEEMLGTC
ncbi:HNH endonuclease [Nocardiopsis gilva YIM 90087]|uniref:HNH endonuclease n=1 Tax=Nocardiopsis gilva YIM 90087 TaxID=1235441 RepID=A0A223S8F7_9ACTN|nr:HNH endonuclease family protein [Nocardiopsis gilva]ASU84403.1 HNH endonuclease [Nocardiopsis gilva YIM 90087]